MFGRRDSNSTPLPPENPEKTAVAEKAQFSADEAAIKTETAPAAAHTEAASTAETAPVSPPKKSPSLANKKAEARLASQSQEDQNETPKKTATPTNDLEGSKLKIYGLLMEQIDIGTASRLPREELKQQIQDLIGEIVMEQRLPITQSEQMLLSNQILDDMLGFGPLEPLLKDSTITDIMVNGPDQVYVEAKGKLTLTDVVFRDEEHVMSVATRIVTGVGRRVDESSPICDARLPDGSRVNVIAPPLSLKGTTISIRKFSEKKITLDVMASQNNVSDKLCKLLKIAAACRLNIIISGGTGSGKTTLLNALSQMIDHGERVVTIEDAAELQLQQPHVVPLETRPPNLEGQGEISMRDLVKNSLRMRPDRIILGEVRGAEALDLLQAMNTGHDGSMGTLHANNPREALTRLENMVGMGASNLPSKALRTQISSAVNMIVQISRMRDGMRRITHVSEIVGMEGEVIVTQDLYHYEYQGEDEHGTLLGEFKSTGLRPHFTERAAYYGLEQALLETL